MMSEKLTKKKLEATVWELGNFEFGLDAAEGLFPDNDEWGEIRDCIRDAIMRVQDAKSLIRDKLNAKAEGKS